MAVALSASKREEVEAAIRPARAEKRIVKRGEALLLLATGVAGVAVTDVAELVGVHERTAYEWKRRFADAEDVVKMLRDAPHPGRPRALSRTPMPRA